MLLASDRPGLAGRCVSSGAVSRDRSALAAGWLLPALPLPAACTGLPCGGLSAATAWKAAIRPGPSEFAEAASKGPPTPRPVAAGRRGWRGAEPSSASRRATAVPLADLLQLPAAEGGREAATADRALLLAGVEDRLRPPEGGEAGASGSRAERCSSDASEHQCAARSAAESASRCGTAGGVAGDRRSDPACQIATSISELATHASLQASGRTTHQPTPAQTWPPAAPLTAPPAGAAAPPPPPAAAPGALPPRRAAPAAARAAGPAGRGQGWRLETAGLLSTQLARSTPRVPAPTWASTSSWRSCRCGVLPAPGGVGVQSADWPPSASLAGERAPRCSASATASCACSSRFCSTRADRSPSTPCSTSRESCRRACMLASSAASAARSDSAASRRRRAACRSAATGGDAGVAASKALLSTTHCGSGTRPAWGKAVMHAAGVGLATSVAAWRGSGRRRVVGPAGAASSIANRPCLTNHAARVSVNPRGGAVEEVGARVGCCGPFQGCR